MKTHPIYESPKKEANERKYGLNSNSCVCCGKPTAEHLYIHATTDWKAVDTTEEIANSQGAFPIGPECAKHFPKGFIFKNLPQ
jgi:hypothetical protein